MTNTLTPAPFFAYEEMWQEVFARLKERYPDRILLRSVSSDLLGLTIDSVIFVTIAFAGVAPLLPLIIGQVVAKNIIGFLDTQWFWWYKRYLEKA
jgi:uncharacterized PurR-regulated membrane protein YhhQ (DUF165 family)